MRKQSLKQQTRTPSTEAFCFIERFSSLSCIVKASFHISKGGETFDIKQQRKKRKERKGKKDGETLTCKS
jgi:hypothetical protein